MTILTHTGGSLLPARRSPEGAAGTGAANARLATIRRVGIRFLTVLAAGAAVAVIVALKATLFVWVYHYY
jgi:hypothetical protein